MRSVRPAPSPDRSGRTSRERANDLSLAQLVGGSVLLNLFLGGLEQVFITPSGSVTIVGVLPAWLLFVALIAFLRDDSAFEAGMLVAAATAAGIFTKLLVTALALRIRGTIPIDTKSSLIVGWIVLPVLYGALAGIPASLSVGVVRLVQRMRRRSGARSA